jgi:hypothetical protein
MPLTLGNLLGIDLPKQCDFGPCGSPGNQILPRTEREWEQENCINRKNEKYTSAVATSANETVRNTGRARGNGSLDISSCILSPSVASCSKAHILRMAYMMLRITFESGSRSMSNI